MNFHQTVKRCATDTGRFSTYPRTRFLYRMPRSLMGTSSSVHHSYLLRSIHQVTQYPSLPTFTSVLKPHKMHPKTQQGPRSVCGSVSQLRCSLPGMHVSLLFHCCSPLPLGLSLFPHLILILILIVKCPLSFPPSLLVCILVDITQYRFTGVKDKWGSTLCKSLGIG